MNKTNQHRPLAKAKKRAIIFSVIYAAIMIPLLVSTFHISPIDKSVTQFCYDEVSVFSSQECISIDNQCASIQKKCNINVLVLTCNRTSSGYASKNGETFIAEHGEYTLDTNFVIIIINSYEYADSRYDFHFDIYTFGDSAKKISDREIEKILYSDAGDEILEGHDVAGAAIKMVGYLGTAYAGIYSRAWLGVTIASMAIGSFVSMIVVLVIRSKYLKRKIEPNYSFQNNATLKMRVANDSYSHNSVTSVIIATSNGGGGGHFSSGGGGGGGHRGGR